MRRWHGLDEVPADWGRSVVTIGVFDGVHRGHQRIVARASEFARELELPTVVITFDPHPDEVVRPGTHPPLLCSPKRRAELLAGLGADAVMILPFTLELSRMGPDEFVQSVLVDRLHAARVVVGEDFRFGHKARGDVALLRELGDKYDFEAEGVPLVANGEPISSTRIRERLSAGDVDGAAQLLGRPHRVEGVVVRGARRGRELGFPTANLELPPHTAIPSDGVYAGHLNCAGYGQARGDDSAGFPDACWPAAISIGTNPTFEGEERTVEAYALDRDDLDLYGEHVSVDFTARLRDTLKFDSIESLVEQMRRDVDRAREITGS
ncbi:bifunctional riboflavin kinase/FAD synthetase [Actinoallomurus rhizosphaericola]|uniref:bifunctional riboflavin kinase/FAD synthetase n=1 Tax=Actinoallomurus rhizosphaericola TaxID=2952536 RepID=UPI0020916EAE|nr:bifunctional riboflavin kinase/FAD synthetase [Actinoallomurus rhizosphaericola]MCO5992322.1 bifunctional riboflavin kinase/FAD synthetase [Actinoallomurus rhizosphaericola]